jgi:hypothetical protein
MKTFDRSLIAPCGIDCSICELYKENITDEFATAVAARIGKPKEELPCLGCRPGGGHCTAISESCATFECVSGKKVDFCFECDEFPCSKLQPMAAGADRLPHNIKLYNLCRIKLIGIEKWAAEESVQTKQKYFAGKFVIGKGADGQ